MQDSRCKAILDSREFRGKKKDTVFFCNRSLQPRDYRLESIA